MTEKHQPYDGTPVDFHRGEDKMKHYALPEGYLQNMQVQIMSNLNREHLHTSVKPTSWWLKLKPSLYLAASFIGLWIGFKGLMHFQNSLHTQQDKMVDIEDSYLRYYEDYAEMLLTEEAQWAWGEELEMM